MSRWPVLQVTAVKVCPNNVWPRSWTTVTSGYFEPRSSADRMYGSSPPASAARAARRSSSAAGSSTGCYGRNGYAIQVTYTNGYPHCSLTAACAAGDIDDRGERLHRVGDRELLRHLHGRHGPGRPDSGQQEAVHVTAASATAGPGTLTLSSPLGYPHQAGTLVTTLPAAVEQACIYFCTAEALTRGATSTTIHAVGGAAQSSDSGARALIEEGELLVHAFRRTV